MELLPMLMQQDKYMKKLLQLQLFNYIPEINTLVK